MRGLHRPTVAAAFFVMVLLPCLGACAGPAAQVAVPEPDMTEMEPQVEKRLREVRAAVLAARDSATAWGRYGMVAHAHELWDEAEVCYRQAQFLDDRDARWPYFLGDVLSIVGTDLEASARAFRRALLLRPDYAPAHMRLGNVLVAANRSQEAGVEFERALELEPDLQPAQVALAQIRLAQGEFEEAEILLEKVLQASPRHGQALSTLGQVLMRQGRREEARLIAGQARDAAAFNLFDDPLMSEVVAEGVSSVEIWERAMSFLDNGNYEQAVLGLNRVAVLQPENSDVQFQLAVAHGNLGDLDRARRHFERTVELDSDHVEARIRLASLYLELGNAAGATPLLERAAELEPQNPEPVWLLAKTHLAAGDPRGALAAFEAARATGLEVPVWAHNEWGSALAQTGQVEAALAHFRTALEAEPGNAQAHFYTGLVFEGLGRLAEAAEHYRQALDSGPNDVVSARLAGLEKAVR